MSQQELLKRIIQTLETAQIPYMLTGSLVSSLQGEPRSTHDMDVVVSLNRQSAARLLAALPGSEFYFDANSALEAVDGKSMFNLISKDGADKVDFWMLTEDQLISRASRGVKRSNRWG
ncbi:MAG: hypothetical protein L0387_09840 [Acidobacteria bacterium]|nr:hypothetical protein [Acidobacteriota bacterium]MCI0721150.1 hypothetical protein [Acidobacteriota bacterium]